MKRAMEALREWLALRARVREEHDFHMDQAAAEYQAMGLSRRASYRAARRRFGGRCNIKSALREIGGDLAGLIHLLVAHRVPAWPGFPFAVLAAMGALLLLLSPSAKMLLEDVAGTPFAARDRETIFLSTQARNLSFAGLTPADFGTLRRIADLTDVEPYLGIHARARVAHGRPLPMIEPELQARMGNPHLRVIPLFDRRPIVMGPARAAWTLLLLWAVWPLRMHLRRCKHRRSWLLYAVATGALHCATSMLLWAFAMQSWTRVQWSTDGRGALALLILVAAYIGSATVQARWWMLDLNRRCPICLDGLLLSVTAGTADRMVLNSATTESICPHGHGVLVETRWSRWFRAERSPLEGSMHA